MATLETTFTVPAAVYEQAIKKSKSRNPKFLADFLKNAAGILAVPVETLRTAIDEETERRKHEQEAKEARAKLDSVVSGLNGIKVPAEMRKLIADLHAAADTLDIHAEVSFNKDGSLAINVSASDVSEKSRISSWYAYERGQREGDTFKLEKLGRRQYRDPVSGETFTNLTGWIRENQPNSHAADVLRRYGQF